MTPAPRESAEFVRFIPFGSYDGVIDEIITSAQLTFEGELWARYDSNRPHEEQTTWLYIKLLNPQQRYIEISYWKEE